MSEDWGEVAWRSYSPAEIESARRALTRRFKVDATDYEAIWFLRDQHEPGWRYRKDKPADRLVECLTPHILAQGIEARRAETRSGSVLAREPGPAKQDAP